MSSERETHRKGCRRHAIDAHGAMAITEGVRDAIRQRGAAMGNSDLRAL